MEPREDACHFGRSCPHPALCREGNVGRFVSGTDDADRQRLHIRHARHGLKPVRERAVVGLTFADMPSEKIGTPDIGIPLNGKRAYDLNAQEGSFFNEQNLGFHRDFLHFYIGFLLLGRSIGSLVIARVVAAAVTRRTGVIISHSPSFANRSFSFRDGTTRNDY